MQWHSLVAKYYFSATSDAVGWAPVKPRYCLWGFVPLRIILKSSLPVQCCLSYLERHSTPPSVYEIEIHLDHCTYLLKTIMYTYLIFKLSFNTYMFSMAMLKNIIMH